MLHTGAPGQASKTRLCAECVRRHVFLVVRAVDIVQDGVGRLPSGRLLAPVREPLLRRFRLIASIYSVYFGHGLTKRHAIIHVEQKCAAGSSLLRARPAYDGTPVRFASGELDSPTTQVSCLVMHFVSSCCWLRVVVHARALALASPLATVAFQPSRRVHTEPQRIVKPM